MSHYTIDRAPPRVPARPDPEAIRKLDEALASRAKRRQRSLQTCHRPAHRPETPLYPHHTGAYVPQFSARLLNDPNLSDGARRCAAKLLEIAYRRNRAGRSFDGTVLYLAKCLGRSERAVQNYLAQLRTQGYIRHQVVRSTRARMCIGILVTLLEPCFPRHHARSWPEGAGGATKSGVKGISEKYRARYNKGSSFERMAVEEWALRCMQGVFRSLMKTPGLCYGSPT